MPQHYDQLAPRPRVARPNGRPPGSGSAATPALPAPQLPKTQLTPGQYWKRAAGLVPDVRALEDLRVAEDQWDQFRRGQTSDFTQRSRGEFSQTLDDARTENLAAVEAGLGPAPWRAAPSPAVGDLGPAGAAGAAGPVGPGASPQDQVNIFRGDTVTRHPSAASAGPQSLGNQEPFSLPPDPVNIFRGEEVTRFPSAAASLAPVGAQAEQVLGVPQSQFGREASLASESAQRVALNPTLNTARDIQEGLLPPSPLTPQQQGFGAATQAQEARLSGLDAQIAAAGQPVTLPPFDPRLSPQPSAGPTSQLQQMNEARGAANMRDFQAQQQAQQAQQQQVYQAARGARTPGKVFDRAGAEARAEATLEAGQQTIPELQARIDAGEPVPTQAPAEFLADAKQRLVMQELAAQNRQSLDFRARGLAPEAQEAQAGAFIGDPALEDFRGAETARDELIAKLRPDRIARQQAKTGAALPTDKASDPEGINALARNLGVQDRAQGLRPDVRMNRLEAKSMTPGQKMTFQENIQLHGIEGATTMEQLKPEYQKRQMFQSMANAASAAGQPFDADTTWDTLNRAFSDETIGGAATSDSLTAATRNSTQALANDPLFQGLSEDPSVANIEQWLVQNRNQLNEAELGRVKKLIEDLTASDSVFRERRETLGAHGLPEVSNVMKFGKEANSEKAERGLRQQERVTAQYKERRVTEQLPTFYTHGATGFLP